MLILHKNLTSHTWAVLAYFTNCYQINLDPVIDLVFKLVESRKPLCSHLTLFFVNKFWKSLHS